MAQEIQTEALPYPRPCASTAFFARVVEDQDSGNLGLNHSAVDLRIPVQVAQFNRELSVISHAVVVVSLTARSFRIAPWIGGFVAAWRTTTSGSE
jgi:hypothetical protein